MASPGNTSPTASLNEVSLSDTQISSPAFEGLHFCMALNQSAFLTVYTADARVKFSPSDCCRACFLLQPWAHTLFHTLSSSEDSTWVAMPNQPGKSLEILELLNKLDGSDLLQILNLIHVSGHLAKCDTALADYRAAKGSETTAIAMVDATKKLREVEAERLQLCQGIKKAMMAIGTYQF